MDRREAMLRELNLYPMWVRREMPAQPDSLQHDTLPEISATLASHEVVPVQLEVKHAVHDLIAPLPAQAETTAGVTESPVPAQDVRAEPVHEAPSLFDNLPDSDFQNTVEGPDSLRAFQLKVAAGPLADFDWPELKQKVSDCQLCDLRAGCTQPVFGIGSDQADWLFVGEAPGKQEDVQGEPFVGHAGRLLDNMLLAMKLKRGRNVYIANVIKCRPPEDRHPHVAEIAHCLPYLKRQIALIKPKVIVALGKTAAHALLGQDEKIAFLRGTLHDYQGIPLVVTYHPAYLLRSPMEKAKAWEDLCLALETMQKVINATE